MRAMARVVETLGIEAHHVLFGHLHHPGEWMTHGGTRLLNTGTWRGPDAVAACVLVRGEDRPELTYPLAGDTTPNSLVDRAALGWDFRK